MSEKELKETILAVLATIAPEADLSEIDPDELLQDELDVDSIDFSNFVLGLYKKTGIEIPERDYPKILSLNGCVAYLLGKAVAS